MKNHLAVCEKAPNGHTYPCPKPTITTRHMPHMQGHLMLVGPPGSGRRTMARLAAHMSRVALFEAALKDNQRGLNWRDMLKQMMHTAGVQGRWVGSDPVLCAWMCACAATPSPGLAPGLAPCVLCAL